MVVEKVLVANEAYVSARWRNRLFGTMRPTLGTIEYWPGHARLTYGRVAFDVPLDEVTVHKGEVAWWNVALAGGVALWSLLILIVRAAAGLVWAPMILGILAGIAAAVIMKRNVYWLAIEANVGGDRGTVYITGASVRGWLGARWWAEQLLSSVSGRH